MGTYPRRKPKRLAEKLRRVREVFGDSQNGVIRRLGFEDQLTQSDISAFERGTREPPLIVLLKYSELTRVWVNTFIDDEAELPDKIPSDSMQQGVKRKSSKGKRPH
jgi:transcriptional regulator with XRE-family HTH domain